MEIKAERNNNEHSGMGIEQQVSTKDTRNSAAGTNHRYDGVGIGQCLSKNRRNATNQVKHDKAHMAHRVFYVVPEYPEVQHISSEMHEATMQKHGCNRCQNRCDQVDVGRQVYRIKQNSRNNS